MILKLCRFWNYYNIASCLCYTWPAQIENVQIMLCANFIIFTTVSRLNLTKFNRSSVSLFSLLGTLVSRRTIAWRTLWLDLNSLRLDLTQTLHLHSNEIKRLLRLEDMALLKGTDNLLAYASQAILPEMKVAPGLFDADRHGSASIFNPLAVRPERRRQLERIRRLGDSSFRRVCHACN